MSYFRKLDKNKYQLIADLGYRGKKRVRKTKTIHAKNDKEAQRQLILFEAELEQKKDMYFSDSENITLIQLYPRWKEHYAKQRYSPRTLPDYVTNLEKRILPEFGDMKVKDIKKVDITFFINNLQKGNKRLDGKEEKLKPSTIRNIYKAFANIMSAAVEWELIEETPCKNIPLPKLDSEEGQVYGEEEIEKLFERLRSEDNLEKLIMIELALTTGCRQGEIAAIEAKHLNVKNNTILIEQSLAIAKKEEFKEAIDGLILKETKGKRKRVITISEYVMKNLIRLSSIKKSQLEQVGDNRKWKNHMFIFSDEYGKPYRPDSISQWWRRFMERNSDLSRIRFHDLRHTSASLLIDSGEHLKTIQQRLGHSNFGTTMDIYGHLLPGSDQRAASNFLKRKNKFWANFGLKFSLYKSMYKNKKPRNR